MKCIVVEGKNDKRRLERVALSDVFILCTNGTMDEEALIELIEPYEYEQLFCFFDRDASGDYLRKQMKRAFSEAVALYVPIPYVQVEELPEEVLTDILKRAKI